MIAGREADTLLFSEEAVRRARKPKELFIVEGKGHVALYDQLEGHSEKLVSFHGGISLRLIPCYWPWYVLLISDCEDLSRIIL